MNREDHDTIELLATLRDNDPAGASKVSIDQAVKDGRRRVYTRRSFGVLTTVAAIVAVSVSSSMVGNLLNSEPPAAGRPGPTRFRIAAQEFKVGSAGGYKPLRYETGDMQQAITLRPADPKGPLKNATGTVRLWPTGRPFTYAGSGELPEASRAERLPGGEFYVLRTGNVRFAIAWRWAADAWGFVDLDELPPNLSEGDGIARAVHVAESVSYGPVRQMTYPFTIRDKDLVIEGITGVVFSMEPSNGRRAVSIKMADHQPNEVDESWFTVGVQPSGQAGRTNTTINGKPASQTPRKVVIPNIGHGYDAVCEISAVDFFDGVERCRLLAAAVRLVTKPLDERAWRTDPTR